MAITSRHRRPATTTGVARSRSHRVSTADRTSASMRISSRHTVVAAGTRSVKPSLPHAGRSRSRSQSVMMTSAGAVLSGIRWLQQLHDHRWVAPVPYGPRPRSNAQLNRPSIDYATALIRQATHVRRQWLVIPRDPRRFVIFVDDLERCRPPRAVEVCEVASQLLGHPNVVTVLVADMATIAT